MYRKDTNEIPTHTYPQKNLSLSRNQNPHPNRNQNRIGFMPRQLVAGFTMVGGDNKRE
jgi:hypothetical protein